jgi:hypothetical protein
VLHYFSDIFASKDYPHIFSAIINYIVPGLGNQAKKPLELQCTLHTYNG